MKFPIKSLQTVIRPRKVKKTGFDIQSHPRGEDQILQGCLPYPVLPISRLSCSISPANHHGHNFLQVPSLRQIYSPPLFVHSDSANSLAFLSLDGHQLLAKRRGRRHDDRLRFLSLNTSYSIIRHISFYLPSMPGTKELSSHVTFWNWVSLSVSLSLSPSVQREEAHQLRVQCISCELPTNGQRVCRIRNEQGLSPAQVAAICDLFSSIDMVVGHDQQAAWQWIDKYLEVDEEFLLRLLLGGHIPTPPAGQNGHV